MIGVGNELLSQAFTEKKEGETTQVSDAVEEAEIRAAREMRAAMKRMKAELEIDKSRALDAQKTVSFPRKGGGIAPHVP